jgi:hypothetical protein
VYALGVVVNKIKLILKISNMKKIHLFLIVTIVISFSACKKTDDTVVTPPYKCATCKTTPDAMAANDGSNKGIYKGVVLGSSGTIVFDLQNNGTTITAVMVIDGTTANLSSTVDVVEGQPYVAPFSGTLNGQPVSITFSIGTIGQNPTVTTSSIPGHPNSSFAIVKENSTSLLECFEGTAVAGSETHTFNLILSRGLKVYKGAEKLIGASSSKSFNGNINTANELIDAASNKSIGKLTSDKLDGVFAGGTGPVTVSSKRTF